MRDSLGWDAAVIGQPTTIYAADARHSEIARIDRDLEATGRAAAILPLRGADGAIRVCRMRFTRKPGPTGVWRTRAYILDLGPDRRKEPRAGCDGCDGSICPDCERRGNGTL